FRGAEARERALAVRVADVAQTLRGGLERLLPRGLAEDLVPLLGIDGEVLVLRHARLADERLRQPVAMLHVVEAVAALHAETGRVRRAVTAFNVENLVALDVVRELTADAAVRTDGVDRFVRRDLPDLTCRHQRAGRTRLHALAAC